MIHLISGKGGVGKSTVAAALAWRLASEGRRTLLVELGDRSYFRHVFHNEIGPVPVPLTSLLSVARWEGEACLREYLQHLVKIERVVNLFFDNRVMRALVQAAPALKELALFGKITSGPRRIGPPLPYDDLVVDAYATGHFRALWRAPIGLAEAIPFGPMGEQSRSIVRVLRDPTLTQIYVTLVPEEMPLTEGLELARDIHHELGQRPQLVVNRWLHSPLTEPQLAPFQRLEFAAYVNNLLARQRDTLEQVAQSGWASFTLPWLFADSVAERIRRLSSDWREVKA